MKNIFYFATKELSQDAFIKWLISNYDENDDLELKNTSLSFIRFLTNDIVSVEELSKSNIVVFSQVNHVDISVYIYPNKESDLDDLHDVIVIEDKTFSSEHNQLITYNNAIDKWKNVNRVFKAFYKTSTLSSKDEDGIKVANKNQQFKWQVFDINRIWDFFKDKTESNSQVLNNYIEYIGHIYSAFKCETDDSIDKWEPYHWEGFVNKYLKKYDNPNSDKEEYLWFNNYQGRYVSICYQRCLPSPNNKDAAVLEIFIRNQKQMSATFHHSFYTDENSKRKWSINDCPEKIALRESLIRYIKEISKNSNSSVKKARSNATNTFGRFIEEVDIVDEKHLLIIANKWIEQFKEIVDSFDSEI